MNQIPNIEEIEDVVDELLEKHVHPLPDGENIKHEFSPLRHEIHQDIVALHHQQLQKAHQDWLREEIVKLEGMKNLRIDSEDYGERKHNDGKYNALQTIIDRYHSELDQEVSK